MDRMWGYWAALTVALLFGLWYTIDKILLGHLQPFALAALTYLIASATLLTISKSPIHLKVLSILHG
ncbi:MAG: EamA family transporter, partial [Methanobacterium sp.]|nr:EamA family transporter [Methanobacterium sp.]